MSLSFPILLSTVPLHAFDYTRNPAELTVHRFSDGGIRSNFPLHFFDHALPEHPTFAINLAKVASVSDDQAQNVSMPSGNGQSVLARVNEVRTLGQFAGALKNSVQNWVDSMQTHVPGYGDRIIAVMHTGGEGGLNLDMDGPTVERLAELGHAAGSLADEFNIVNHRWVRFRSFINLLENLVVPAAAALDADAVGDVPSYREMIAGAPPDSYRTLWNTAAGDRVADVIIELPSAFEDVRMADGRSRFEEGAPRPIPELQIRPRP